MDTLHSLGSSLLLFGDQMIKILLVLLLCACAFGCQRAKKKEHYVCDPRFAFIEEQPTQPDWYPECLPPLLEPHLRSGEEMQEEYDDQNVNNAAPPCNPDDPRYDERDNWA